jgi:S-formylglutathione hydrolase
MTMQIRMWSLIVAAAVPVVISGQSTAARRAQHDVEIVGLDYAFRVPTNIPAGQTTFHFRNDGKVAHELSISLLKNDATVQQFMDARLGNAPGNAYREATVGVLLAAPGHRASAGLVTDLLPGRTYVLICINRDNPKAKPHFAMGMVSALTVGSRPAPPVPATHVDTIVASEYAYQYPRTLRAGHHRFAFVNAGKVRHEFVMLQLKHGVTLQQLLDVQKSAGNTDSMIDDAIGVLHSPAGTSTLGLLDVDMLPGRDYTIICTLADDDKSRPHVMLGMQGTIRVTGAMHAPAARHGRIIIDTLRTASLINRLGAPAQARVSIYLPPSYDASANRRYPVLYLLHGFGSSDAEWTDVAPDRGIHGRDIGGMMDSLIAASAVREMIIVMPDASNRLGGSFYVNSGTTGRWEDFMVHDLVSHLDHIYRTLATPASRGIAGASMGGFGAFYLSMRHGGDTYGAMYAMSACCVVPIQFDSVHDVAAWDTVATLTSFAQLERSAPYARVLAAASAAFAPDSMKPPFFFAIEKTRSSGVLAPDEHVAERWEAHSPLHMVQQYRDNLLRMRAIQFDIGARDEAVPPTDVMRMDTALTRAAVPHRFETYDGTHTSNITERLATRVLPFFSRNLVFGDRPATQHGRIVTDTVSAASLANLLGAPAQTRVSIYLPPSYDTSPRHRYPVVYLLHGFGITDSMWVATHLSEGLPVIDVRSMMDSLVAARAVKEMILVMPNASGALGGSFYVNSVATGNWDDFISRDLVAYVDAKFRTLATPESRGLAGHSMGGYGTLYLGMRHGGTTYRALYAMSACCTGRFAFDSAEIGAAWDSISSFRSVEAVKHSGFMPSMLTARSAALVSDAARPPLYFDLVESRDDTGWTANAAVVTKWDEHSPLLMISRYRDNMLRMCAIQLDIGLQDRNVPPSEIMALDTALVRAGIPHVLETYAGNHFNRVPERLATRVLPFFSRNLIFEERKE